MGSRNHRDARDTRGLMPLNIARVEDTTSRRRLLLRTSGIIWVVRVADIDWCQASGNYVAIHARGETHVVRRTMSRLEEELQPPQFLRIHRSTLVNVSSIDELRLHAGQNFEVILKGGVCLTGTRMLRHLFVQAAAAGSAA